MGGGNERGRGHRRTQVSDRGESVSGGYMSIGSVKRVYRERAGSLPVPFGGTHIYTVSSRASTRAAVVSKSPGQDQISESPTI